jgi:hypothetical protein
MDFILINHVKKLPSSSQYGVKVLSWTRGEWTLTHQLTPYVPFVPHQNWIRYYIDVGLVLSHNYNHEDGQ